MYVAIVKALTQDRHHDHHGWRDLPGSLYAIMSILIVRVAVCVRFCLILL